ncbi:peptide ABC transporter [Parafrankia colletiae]|uniref:Peptide ABC transporter n=1 Tax=Parafrankia colletiae TaxID=573497 RepID=A0A1S1QAH0_9ACTN|nr:ABC transporter permease [Parafrankia colletiae]MCK9903097.1 ABC transporter permease [Frankia sp. Cpl3]OHV30960.1 peptide ABC transporter [Parafrankia colletiae]
MTPRLGSRVLRLLVVLFVVSFFSFIMVDLVPGDAAVQVLGENGTPEDYHRVRDELGLDQPVLTRYVTWLGAVLHGDFGQNLVAPVRDVRETIADALPVNIELALLALLLALLIAIPAALLSVRRPGGRADRWVSAACVAIISVPGFIVGLLLLLLFAINWQVLPVGQWAGLSDTGLLTNLRFAVLPALTLALPEAAVFIRLLRRDLLATMGEDFITVARAKGMPTRHILLREALRPSSFSLVTLVGVNIGHLIAGSVIVEQVYSLPGMGSVIVRAAQTSDYPVVQMGVLVLAALYVVVNFAVDVLYGVLDPRVRRAHA